MGAIVARPSSATPRKRRDRPIASTTASAAGSAAPVLLSAISLSDPSLHRAVRSRLARWSVWADDPSVKGGVRPDAPEGGSGASFGGEFPLTTAWSPRGRYVVPLFDEDGVRWMTGVLS